MRISRRKAAAVALVAGITMLLPGCSLNSSPSAKKGSLADKADLKGTTVTVGSKEFTEQLVLCNITSLALKSAGATVKTKCGLSGSNTARTALTSGSIDMYWEYTGTAWVNYLKHTKPITDSVQQYDAVAKEDLAKNQIKWLDRSTANNTYALAVKTTTANQLQVKTLSDYAKLAKSDPTKASVCIASEFAGRSDGWPGVEKTYGFTMPKANVATLAEGAIYNAVGKGKPCNFGESFTTDGRIKALKLTTLTDDKKFFPVYNPALNVRQSVVKAHPGIATVMNEVTKGIDTKTLQDLNSRVDVSGQDPKKVAEDWMKSKGYIGK
ncbi:MAG: glycine betaine ABC transporter substrate-binding protein [Streptosporangiales bacterium]|nr:glycine betaine ABC transporter substrate-binding protein [Streptosporangiales bacterium]MBO0891133.1 glycine betaine ABC transporter substrate-binding protein [Acidothermales bacterium]